MRFPVPSAESARPRERRILPRLVVGDVCSNARRVLSSTRCGRRRGNVMLYLKRRECPHAPFCRINLAHVVDLDVADRTLPT